MRFGLIIAAGNQTRFKSETPKALAEVYGKPLLYFNVINMSKVCEEIFIVCSNDKEKYFKDFLLKYSDKFNRNTSIHILPIVSGRGCGDAVLQALKYIDSEFDFWSDDKCFIQWGDSLHEERIYRNVVDKFTDKLVIPCVYEESPYVQIVEHKDCVEVLYSKYGDKITSGYHDLSLFYGNCLDILNGLKKLEKMFWVEEEKSYVNNHGNELTFLDIMNYAGVNAEVLDMKTYKDFSFNTVEDLENRLEGK